MEKRGTTHRLLTATEFEFRHRFWIIGLVFWAAFSLYGADHVNVVEFLVDRTVGHDSPRADAALRAAFALAALCVLAAALLRTWAAAYLRAEVVQDPGLHAETLIADGPYRHTRNPLYLGSMLLALGFGALASRAGFVVAVVLLVLFFLRLIGIEEALLVRERGENYAEFRRRVPRLWPSLAPRVPASGLAARWGQAFVGELFMWGFFLAMAVFAVTLEIRATWVIVGLVLVLYAVRTTLHLAKSKRPR